MNKSNMTEMKLDILRREARALTRISDWEKAIKIEADHDKLRNTQTRKYHNNRAKRIEMAATRMAERNGINFDNIRKRRDLRGQRLTGEIMRRAERDVIRDHARRINRINQSEGKELRTLIETARERERLTRENPNQPNPPKQITDGRNDPARHIFNRTR